MFSEARDSGQALSLFKQSARNLALSVGTSAHTKPDVLLGAQTPSLLQTLLHPNVLGPDARTHQAVLRCHGPERRHAWAMRDAGYRAPRGQRALHGLLHRLCTTDLSRFTSAAREGHREC